MNNFIPDTNSLYGLIESARHSLSPSRFGLIMTHKWLEQPNNPFSKTHLASLMKAA